MKGSKSKLENKVCWNIDLVVEIKWESCHESPIGNILQLTIFVCIEKESKAERETCRASGAMTMCYREIDFSAFSRAFSWSLSSFFGISLCSRSHCRPLSITVMLDCSYLVSQSRSHLIHLPSGRVVMYFANEPTLWPKGEPVVVHRPLAKRWSSTNASFRTHKGHSSRTIKQPSPLPARTIVFLHLLPTICHSQPLVFSRFFSTALCNPKRKKFLFEWSKRCLGGSWDPILELTGVECAASHRFRSPHLATPSESLFPL